MFTEIDINYVTYYSYETLNSFWHQRKFDYGVLPFLCPKVNINCVSTCRATFAKDLALFCTQLIGGPSCVLFVGCREKGFSRGTLTVQDVEEECNQRPNEEHGTSISGKITNNVSRRPLQGKPPPTHSRLASQSLYPVLVLIYQRSITNAVL